MYRSYQNIDRRKSRLIKVGKVLIGKNNPISVQTMTNTLTTDHKSTIEQINKVTEAGADRIIADYRDLYEVLQLLGFTTDR